MNKRKCTSSLEMYSLLKGKTCRVQLSLTLMNNKLFTQMYSLYNKHNISEIREGNFITEALTMRILQYKT